MSIVSALQNGKRTYASTLPNNVNINCGDGNNTIRVTANDSSIDVGDGRNNILLIGSNEEITAGDGDNTIIFWGDDYDISAGDGDNTVATLDFAITQGMHEEYEDYLTDDKDITSVTHNELVNSSVDDIAAKYNLSAAEKAKLKGVDLTQLRPNGEPMYIIAKGDTDNKYHVYKYRRAYNSSTDQYLNILGAGKLKRGSNYLYVENDEVKKAPISTTTHSTTTTTTTATINGVTNVNIDLGDGSNSVALTAGFDDDGDDENININVGGQNVDFDEGVSKNNILVRGSYEVTHTEVKDSIKTGLINLYQATGGYQTGSPLIIDYNQDGQVSAEHGIGVDIDGDGIADGAATGGDKMLAMTDLNGNGTIDGTEVFGDNTVDPFTGEALNAANGFEALALVAKSAQAHTGIECINEDGTVDLAALNRALEIKGISLGFVSDDNNKVVEELSKVATIDTANYIEQDATGDVQHRQLGTATFIDGSDAKVDDVWFTLSGRKNPFANLFS